MSQKIIVIEVKVGGAITVEGVGFKGAECEQATAAFEQALGVVKSNETKPEMYDRDETVRVNV